MYWPKLNTQKIKFKIFEALSKNANYRSENILGLPGTFLDTEVFYDGEPFLKDAPFLSTLIANPNHIGCHTLETDHEEIFSGTQEIEKDLIRICAEEIFKAERHGYDGYVASGGTEANIEALWIYRNYFEQEKGARLHEIAVVYSQDTHYSIPKATNLLGIDSVVFNVHEKTREVDIVDLENKLNDALFYGKKYFVAVLNLSTTLFGSVDDIGKIAGLLKFRQVDYKIHVDAAFGGFIYPFTNADSNFTFANPEINSISVDGHKMMQAPYGTGIFLIRKNYMKYVCTEEAAYVPGMDYTLCGSRSGANAICLWMIIHAHGSVGWTVKMNELLQKTNEVCKALDAMGVKYYHNPYVNIIAIKSEYITPHLAKQFYLVPDTHDGEAKWYKIVMMPHVKQEVIDNFLSQLAQSVKIG
jgi:glutamate/tyrosine decarboxylase-like PLP-dependent enzyme